MMDAIYIKALLNGLLFFLTLLILQLFIWRVFKPKKQMLILLLGFFVLPFVLLICSLLLSWSDECTYGLLWTLSLGSAYVMTFPAAAAQSPTLVLINSVVKNKLKSEDEIYRSLGGRLVKDRLEDLESDGLVMVDGDQLKLKKPGRVLAKAFIFIRRLFGLPEGLG